MPIKSGIGFGEAQVYNTGNLTNLYGKLLQQKAAEEAKFAGDLATVMSKYSTKGLKDKDIELTSKAYQQIKDNVSKYSSRNAVDRAKAIAEAQNGIQSIQEYADNALNSYKTLDQVTPDIRDNPWKYENGTGEVIKKLYQLPYQEWPEQYKNINQSTFSRKPDNSSVYQMFNNVNSDLSKIAPNGKEINVPGRTHIKTFYEVPKDEALKNLYTTMELQPQAKYTLTSMYQQANPDKKDFTSADVANFGLNLYQQQYGDNAFKFYGGKEAIPKEKKDDGELSVSQYEVAPKKFYSPSSVGGAPVSPRLTADFSKFVTTKSSSFSPPQLESVYNIATGKDEPMRANKDVKLTGVGYATVKGGGKELRATVVDSDNREYMLQPKDLPVSIRNEKSYKNALGALGSGAVSSTQKPSNSPVIHSATRSEWKSAGWNDAQINQAVKAGQIKLK